VNSTICALLYRDFFGKIRGNKGKFFIQFVEVLSYMKKILMEMDIYAG
jgi:hypothetical protein